MNMEPDARQRPDEFSNQFAPEPGDGRTEVNVVRIPSEDGAEYDLYLVPPEGTTPEDAVKIADEAVAAYFASSGELELFPHLINKGFGFLNIYTTEGTW
jgi:hypothetical protein